MGTKRSVKIFLFYYIGKIDYICKSRNGNRTNDLFITDFGIHSTWDANTESKSWTMGRN